MDVDFGNHVDREAVILDTLKESITALSVKTRLMLTESYDIHYDIFRHDLINNRPMAIMELHEKEKLSTVSPLYELFKTYVECDILKYTGIPYDRFIELPRHITRHLIDDCKRLAQKDIKANQGLLSELENMKNIGKR